MSNYFLPIVDLDAIGAILSRCPQVGSASLRQLTPGEPATFSWDSDLSLHVVFGKMIYRARGFMPTFSKDYDNAIMSARAAVYESHPEFALAAAVFIAAQSDTLFRELSEADIHFFTVGYYLRNHGQSDYGTLYNTLITSRRMLERAAVVTGVHLEITPWDYSADHGN